MGQLDEAPTIDGRIEAEEWAGAGLLDESFVQIEPDFGAFSPYRTVVRIGQTATALYVAFEAFDPDVTRLAAAVTNRDGELMEDDSVTLLLDTFEDRRTAYLFTTNGLGTQEDGRIADNGRTVDLRWDATWRCASLRLDDRWTAEIEIPLSILRFSSRGERAWGVNFVRTVPRRLEKALWSGPAEDVFRVSSFGDLIGLELPRREGKTWQVIPYVQGAVGEAGETDVEVGTDFRWRPSNDVGVDVTINPDFALVEADVETINLTRFELQVPEKRPFFLEGNELFSQRIRQFYSRRIGDITWGAKSNGKLRSTTDFSVIATSEDLKLDSESETERADYAVVRLQQSLPGGSNLGLLAANRRLLGDDAGSIGLDTTLFFTDTLGLTGQVLRVHGPTADGGLAWFIRPAYDSATTHFHVRYTNLDRGILEDFNTVGFLRDDDRKEVDTEVEHTFWLEGAMEKVEAGANYNRYWSQEDVLRSWELRSELELVFRSGWEIELEYLDELQVFEKEFRNDRTVLRGGWNGRDGRSLFAFVGAGVNFDSDLELYGAEAAWPFGDRWRLSYSLTRLLLDPDPEGDTTWIHIFETRYFFHPDNFIKLFFQTNSTIEKENVQALWVWRFKPPFGSLHIAYQRGTSPQGEVSTQGNTFFAKLQWVF